MLFLVFYLVKKYANNALTFGLYYLFCYTAEDNDAHFSCVHHSILSHTIYSVDCELKIRSHSSIF